MSQEISKIIKLEENKKKKLIELIEDSFDKSFIDDLKDEINENFISVGLLMKIKKLSNQKAQKENKFYINDWIMGAELYAPKVEPTQKNPEYEENMRCLRARLEEEEYQSMVRNVDMNSNRKIATSSGLSADFRTQSGQLTSIVNVLAVIGGSFFFGYKAVEFMSEEQSVPRQLIGGFILALIAAVADFYFLFKKLNKLDKKL
ncbi:transmembrane protein -like [Brachionus plicatilis]|uniref:Transmembrane protein-like n=1 Tax=Brachionus plicatilis TaxID=10195 RepID=A0A3M7QJG2_BRAPC|nr:transmembrane protein -like [Brachionus plicatilis]